MQCKIVIISLLLGFCHGQEDGCYRYYPCGIDSIDINCVQKFFLNTGQCTAASYTDGQPTNMTNQYSYVPSLYLIANSTDCQLTFYGSRIVTFFLNTITNNLVLAMDFSGLGLYCPSVCFTLARDKLEPLEFQASVNVTYAATLTAVGLWFPDAIKLKGVSVSAFLTQPCPHFDVRPNISHSQDPAVQQVSQRFNDNKSTTAKEMLQTQAYYFFYGFFQNYICDFGFQYGGVIN